MTAQLIVLTLVSLSAITLMGLELCRRNKELHEEKKEVKFLQKVVIEQEEAENASYDEMVALRDRSRRLAAHLIVALAEIARLRQENR
jgi:hypothetical protein